MDREPVRALFLQKCLPRLPASLQSAFVTHHNIIQYLGVSTSAHTVKQNMQEETWEVIHQKK